MDIEQESANMFLSNRKNPQNELEKSFSKMSLDTPTSIKNHILKQYRIDTTKKSRKKQRQKIMDGYEEEKIWNKHYEDKYNQIFDEPDYGNQLNYGDQQEMDFEYEDTKFYSDMDEMNTGMTKINFKYTDISKK